MSVDIYQYIPVGIYRYIALDIYLNPKPVYTSRHINIPVYSIRHIPAELTYLSRG
jgi:hypothetical protein